MGVEPTNVQRDNHSAIMVVKFKVPNKGISTKDELTKEQNGIQYEFC